MTSEFLRASQHAHGWVTAIGGSSNTRSAYLADIQAFFSWLKIAGVASPLLATGAMVSEYVASLTEASRGESVVRRSVSAIRSYYQFLADNGHVVSNPAAAVQRPPVIKGALQILSVRDTERMLDGAHRRAKEAKPGSAKAISLARSAAMLETLYSGGLEVSELCALPSSLDLSRAGLHQVQTDGARRSVIINARHWMQSGSGVTRSTNMPVHPTLGSSIPCAIVLDRSREARCTATAPKLPIMPVSGSVSAYRQPSCGIRWWLTCCSAECR